MKRSRTINLASMRKKVLMAAPAKPLALAIAAVTLAACSSKEPARVFQNVEECVQAAAGSKQECQQAYDDAIAAARESGPKYASLNDCQSEFGSNQCTKHSGSNGQSWFIPLMAGYMIGDIVGNIGGYNRYQSAPLYTSYSHRSPFFGQWSTVDGNTYGSVRDKQIRVNKQAFEPKPAVKKTISRGGFGSKVAAKSNWGGGKKSGGWGG